MFGVSADGAVVAGYAASEGQSFVWDTTHDMRTLSQWFTDNGLAAYVAGWDAMVATDLSYDGLTMVGYGLHNGSYEGWVVNPVPLPGATLLGVLGLSVVGWRLRHKMD